MRKLIPIIVLALAIQSCGLFKKSIRTVDKEIINIEQKVKKDSVGVTVDKSTTVTTEKIDTVITTPSRTVVTEQIVNIDSLIDAVTNIKNDLFTFKLDYNKRTGVLRSTTTILPQNIPVYLEKVTAKKNDITTNSRVKQEATLNTEIKTKQVTKTKEPAKMGIWLVAFIAGIAAVLFSLSYWLRKKV